MVRNSLGILLVSFCLGSSGLALYRQTKTVQSPPDADQLVIVRITAALNDAVNRRDKAQLEYEKAVRDIQDLQPELRKTIEEARAKLPAPPAGTQWVPEPDGQLGVKFVQAPATGPADKERQKSEQNTPAKASNSQAPDNQAPNDQRSNNAATVAAKPR
ncbi:MAG TPA: hypothetical protein VI756_09375 [Blastocatellia bacterium]